MEVQLIMKIMSKSMLEICKYTKSIMLIDLLGHMQKLATKTHHVSNIWMFNGQIDEFPNNLMIRMKLASRGWEMIGVCTPRILVLVRYQGRIFIG